MNPRARYLIDHLNLQPHPEGGFYAEVFRSAQRVQVADGPRSRSALTSIYFLLLNNGVSRWHRVRSDEVWCHLEGAAVDLHLLDSRAAGSKGLSTQRLGPVSGQVLAQRTVPADVWQAARCVGEYSLLACQVAPGFEFADFDLMDAADPWVSWLARHQPDLAALV